MFLETGTVSLRDGLEVSVASSARIDRPDDLRFQKDIQLALSVLVVDASEQPSHQWDVSQEGNLRRAFVLVHLQQTAEDDLLRMLAAIKAQLNTPIRGGVYYSCLGRGQHMFGAPNRELGLIRDTLGEVPLVGFFANGEISHNRLYGYTGVLTLFG